MNKPLQVLALIAALGFSGAASAALIDHGGGLIYDQDLNVTWLADANVNGLMNWNDAMIWAGNLSYGGYTGWRLPATQQPDATCRQQYNADAPYDIQSYGYDCTGSEMGHLFYNELGGVAGDDIATTHDTNYNLFQNVQSNTYWSGTEYAPNTNGAWYFNFDGGRQLVANKNYNSYAWAVHVGDVGAAVATVPLPATAWLFGSGLLGLLGVARRKRERRAQ